MRCLGRLIRNRSLRAVTVWALVMVQAEFLWFSEFHRHEEVQARRGPAVFILDGKQDSRKATLRPFCLACQIGHERAAKREVARAPIAPALVIHSPVASESQHARPSLLVTRTPRAPPAL